MPRHRCGQDIRKQPMQALKPSWLSPKALVHVRKQVLSVGSGVTAGQHLLRYELQLSVEFSNAILYQQPEEV